MLARLSAYLSFSEEKIEHKGEDSCILSVNENKALCGVFDGCGGIGSRRYEALNSNTGAYIAARAVSECVAAWFDGYSDRDYSGIVNLELADTINNALSRFKQGTDTSRIRGSMTRDFPTTLSVTVIEQTLNGLMANYMWAGDSRGYMLTARGLIQITRDDIDESVDALDNISSDGVLTNVISAGGDYEIHSKTVTIAEPCLVFNATDGCFGYLKTPMEFEYLMLYTLATSKNVNEWKKKLQKSIGSYAGDDHTISLLAYGFATFASMKDYFAQRTVDVYDNYIKPLEHANDTAIKCMWSEYSKVYYGDA